jgi:hypothetical protein
MSLIYWTQKPHPTVLHSKVVRVVLILYYWYFLNAKSDKKIIAQRQCCSNQYWVQGVWIGKDYVWNVEQLSSETKIVWKYCIQLYNYIKHTWPENLHYTQSDPSELNSSKKCKWIKTHSVFYGCVQTSYDCHLDQELGRGGVGERDVNMTYSNPC